MALITKLNNIATAIGQKTGEPASTYTLDNMPAAINSIVTDFPVVPTPVYTEKVRFIDYDGTIVTEMTVDEARELTSLPEIPTHEGLQAVGWTSTLANIQANTHALDVGAMYQSTVDPGQGQVPTVFRIWPDKNAAVTIVFSQSDADGVTIDWGDGSATETVSTAGDVTATHTYSTAGTSNTPFQLVLTPATGVTLELGKGYGKTFFNATTSNTYTTFKFEAIFGACSIKEYAFYGCFGLMSVTIPNSVTEIGHHAFCQCKALKTVILPSTISILRENVFAYCSSLKTVVLPNNLVEFIQYALSSCESIETLVLPQSLQKIGDGSLYGLASLKHLTIPASVTSIGQSLASGDFQLESVVFADGMRLTYSNTSGWFNNCQNLKSVNLPEGVTNTSTNFCTYCYKLTHIGFPSTLAGIAYLQYAMLTDVVLPSGVTMISNNAFSYMYALKSVTIPATLTNLGTNLFSYSPHIETIVFKDRATIPFIANSIFNSNTSIPFPTILDFTDFTQVPTVTNAAFFTGMPSYVQIKVPASLETAWKAASDWSTYANQIVGVE